MKTVKVVGAVLTNENRYILCAQRSKDMSLPGMWEFPGGKMEPGESPQEALVREIKEELLCDIEVGNLVEECIHQYPNVVVHLSTYYATIARGEPTATEHEQLIWFTVDQLRKLAWAPADVPTVEKLTREPR